MSARSYSLRHRLDVVAGVLLLAVAGAGITGLQDTVRQREAAIYLRALHEEERTVSAAALLVISDSESAATEVRSLLQDAERRLGTLLGGGALDLDGTPLMVGPGRGARLAAHLQRARDWIAATGTQVDLRPQELAARLREVQAHLQAAARAADRDAMAERVRAGWIQLVMILLATGCFLLGVAWLRRLVTTPLHRMADMIEEMLRTGRLIKLPVGARNELGIVSEGFNRLTVQAEEQKRRLREHIVELQRVNMELDQLAHVKDDFLMTINHQLRTPLTSVVEGIELVREEVGDSLSAGQREIMVTMDDNARRLAQLVDSMLDLQMLQSGRRPLSRRAASVQPVLQRVLATWQPVAEQRIIRLTAGALPEVYADPGAVGEVLDHLLRNALRHGPKGSVVDIQAQVSGEEVTVTVRDYGPGLTPEQLDKLFQPFVHVHTPDAPGRDGSGLGLAFCRQIVERHRGRIAAEVPPDGGLAVRFTLPVATPGFLFREACEQAQETAEQGHFGVLLVDTSGPAGERVHQHLRANTHHGDAFVALEDGCLAIVAATDAAGFEAMQRRLRQVLEQAEVSCAMGAAHSARAGAAPEALRAAAQAALAGGRARIAAGGSGDRRT